MLQPDLHPAFKAADRITDMNNCCSKSLIIFYSICFVPTMNSVQSEDFKVETWREEQTSQHLTKLIKTGVFYPERNNRVREGKQWKYSLSDLTNHVVTLPQAPPSTAGEADHPDSIT